MKTDNLMIFHPSSKEEIEALKAFANALKIKFEITNEKGYNKEFIEKIKRSKKQHLEGKNVVVKTRDLWK